MVERILAQEGQELEEIVSMMQDADCVGSEHEHGARSDYISDEEELDQLLIEVTSDTEKVDGRSEEAGVGSQHEYQMDVSLD